VDETREAAGFFREANANVRSPANAQDVEKRVKDGFLALLFQGQAADDAIKIGRAAGTIAAGGTFRPGGLFLRFLGVDLPVLLGLRTGTNVGDVRIDSGFGRPLVCLLRAGDAAGGFFFLLLDPRPFPGALHGGWS
jgi:hypothetical protein